MIDIAGATATARRVSGVADVSVVQQADDHLVLDAGEVIVKCGTRDEFGVEAYACEAARSVGVLAPEVIALDATGPTPHLALRKVAGVCLFDARVSREAAARGAREAGAQLRRLHDVPLTGYGWPDRARFRATGDLRGKSTAWVDEVSAELDPAVAELVALGALTTAQAEEIRRRMTAARPTLRAAPHGRFLHGDLGRMHIFVDPDVGALTGLVDWGDVQIGDPAWDLSISACHLASTAEGMLRIHAGGRRDLFPHLLAGYDPDPDLAARLGALQPFYLLYRLTWVARLLAESAAAPNTCLTKVRTLLAAP